MIFYRSKSGPKNLSVNKVRILSAASLVFYPVGALTHVLGPDAFATTLVAFALILMAFVAYWPVVSSSLQRIVSEETKMLDEFELRLRGRAMSLAYMTFTALTLIAVIYAALASERDGWVPDSYDEFNGVFWGVLLYASVLPTAILSWTVDHSFVD